jgi:hypothetical protein
MEHKLALFMYEPPCVFPRNYDRDLHAHFPMHTRFPPQISQGPPPVGKEIFGAANGDGSDWLVLASVDVPTLDALSFGSPPAGGEAPADLETVVS